MGRRRHVRAGCAPVAVTGVVSVVAANVILAVSLDPADALMTGIVASAVLALCFGAMAATRR